MTQGQQWWCPACMRYHGYAEAAPFERDGVQGYSCRLTGAVLEAVAAPADSPPAAPPDERQWWCPACARSHTPQEVTEFTRGSTSGYACVATGAVVEEIGALPNGAPALGAATHGQLLTSDPNLQTVTEVDQVGPPDVADDDTAAATTLDAPADDVDEP